MMLIMKIVMMVHLLQEVAVIYTLNFTAKTYLFGPMQNQKVIKKVQDDLYTDTNTGADKTREGS